MQKSFTTFKNNNNSIQLTTEFKSCCMSHIGRIHLRQGENKVTQLLP